MTPRKNGTIPMDVWCPLIPPEDYSKFSGHVAELQSVNDAYDDWRASLRGKPFIDTPIGVVLDRIRMLMINIGVSCAQDRVLAERVQRIVSDSLRRTANRMISKMPDDENDLLEAVLVSFFKGLRFTRDIYPEEEMEKAVLDHSRRKKPKSKVGKVKSAISGASPETDDLDNGLLELAMREASSIVRMLYLQLMGPDPWGNNQTRRV